MPKIEQEKNRESSDCLQKKQHQKQGLLSACKKTVYAAIFLISGAVSFNYAGLGYPYIKDKSKKYCAKTYTYTSNNGNTMKYKYKYPKDIADNFEEKATLTIKEKYTVTKKDEYTRKVDVYKIKDLGAYNYEDVLNNYKKYANNNKIDEYYETTNKINEEDLNKIEISLKFNQIDKTDYITVEESDFKNITSSFIYTIFALIVSYYYLTSLYEEYDYRKREIDRINKRIKRPTK